MERILLYGGLPQVVLLTSPEEKAALLNNLLNETYISDLQGRHPIKNITFFERLFKLLASDIGSLTNSNRLSKIFNNNYMEKLSYSTIQKYIAYLEDAFLISTTERFDVKGKKYLNSLNKFYFTDLGLRNSLLNFRQIEETHILENIISDPPPGKPGWVLYHISTGYFRGRHACSARKIALSARRLQYEILLEPKTGILFPRAGHSL